MSALAEDARAPTRAGGRRDLLLYALATLALVAAMTLAWARDRALPRAEIAARVAAEQQLNTLRARAEAGGNADSWATYADALSQAGDAGGAVEAFARASALAPRRADLAAAEGEARLLAARDSGAAIPAEARAAFARALAIDLRHPRARFFTAALHMAEGNPRAALDGWLALLADTPRGSPEARELRASIEAVAQRSGIDVSARLAQIDAG